MSKRLFRLASAACLLSWAYVAAFAEGGAQTPVKPAAPAAKAPITALAPTDTVYVLHAGTEYHRKGCRRLLGQEGTPLTHLDAITGGHVACGICKPAGERATGTLLSERKPAPAPAPAPIAAPSPEQAQGQPTAKPAPVSQRPADALVRKSAQKESAAPSITKPDPAARYGPPATSQASPGSGAQGTVFITKTGKMYHRAACRSLRDSKTAISVQDAKARGYTPCTICNP